MKVLLVDDERELVATLAERLSLRGIQADWAISGEEALTLAEDNIYDVAVLDVKIPRMSGLELKKKLKARSPNMKFIFVTGHGSEDDFRIGSAEAGEKYYLAKPVNIEALINTMNEVLKTNEGKA